MPERNSYTFFISDSRARTRSFYYSLLFGSICGIFSIAVGDSDLRIAIVTIVSTSIALWVYFRYYVRQGKVPSVVEEPNMLTRRGSWRYVGYVAAPCLMLAAIARARSLGQRAALAVAHQVNAQTSEALKSYSVKKPVSVSVDTLSARADSVRAVYAGRVAPAPIVEAIVKSRAASVASRLPVSPEYSDDTLYFNAGRPSIGLRLARDAFIARLKCLSSVPYSNATAVEVTNDATVLIYESRIEGLTQTIDGITWVGALFKNCVIRYGGKAVVLSAARFEACSLDASLVSLPNLSSLIRTHNNGTQISFASDL